MTLQIPTQSGRQATIMSRSAVVIDPEFLKHEPGEFHPERPERLKALLELTNALHGGMVQILPPRQAKIAEIEACHDSQYIDLVRSTSETNGYALDGDTVTCADSFGTAVLAVGGFLRLLETMAADELQNGFAMVRPPGHHALRDRAMGFCLFNTIAIGAEYLKNHYGAKRILVMDWDVHHGNGTQDSFYGDPSVLYISTHQYPYYPGTGAMDEVGTGKGEGYTVNIPLPAGCGDDEYLGVFKQIVMPIAAKYEPEWVLVSAGFDPHRQDPLGGMLVTEEGFATMASLLLNLAQKFAGGKVAFLLEGGYNIKALKSSVAAVLQIISGEQRIDLPSQAGGKKIEVIIHKILRLQESYW